MKLLTLNANSYCGENSTRDMANLTEAIADGDYDVIALQEVNQEMNSEPVPISELDNYQQCQDRVPIKQDNYVYQICQALKASGQNWNYTWLPVHVGWSHFDEGLAIMTKYPILKTNAFYVTDQRDYWDITTRMALGIQADFNGRKEWFYSVHFDKWNNARQPFDGEWDRFIKVAGESPCPLFVMGDFNNDGNIKGEALDYIFKTSNLYDTYDRAEYKDNGITVNEYIAGWADGDHPKEMRIDFIFTNTDQPILSSEVVFNGKRLPQVSDHFGLEVTVGDKKKVYKDEPSRRIPEFMSDAQIPSPPSIIITGGALSLDNPIYRRRVQNELLLDSMLDIINSTLEWFESLDE